MRLRVLHVLSPLFTLRVLHVLSSVLKLRVLHVVLSSSPRPLVLKGTDFDVFCFVLLLTVAELCSESNNN